NQFRFGPVGDIDHHHAGVAPGGIGGVAVDDGVMQAEAARAGPARRFAVGLVHAGDPPAASFARFRRVRHVDGDEDVVGEAVDQRRGVGPAPAGVPDAVDAAALD